MEEKQVQLQEFNGEDYFLYDTAMTNSKIYNVFAKVSNPKDLIIAKEIINNGEEYYEIVDGSEYEKALSLFHKEEL